MQHSKRGAYQTPPVCFSGDSMKLKHSVVLVATLLAMACQRERATITSAYGAGVVTGNVVVSGVENTSPAGLQVTVRGTGMMTTLAADGAFSFAGLPDGAELRFRRHDGIDVSLAVASNAGHLLIEVSPKAAKTSGRRRAAGRGGEKVYEFEGLIRSASATELVVYTSRQQEVTILLDAQTVVRKGQQIVSAADLTVGTRVHVKSRKTDDVYTALLVIVQNPAEEEDDDGEETAPRPRKEYEGLVRSASETELVIFDSHGEEVTFVLNAETVIRKGNTPVAATDLQADDRVHVKADTADDGTKTAVLVIVQKMKR